MIPISDNCRKDCNKDTVKYKEFITVPLNQSTVNGTNITLPEDTGSISSVRIKGDITQAFYSGAQLFNVRDVKQIIGTGEATVDNDDWITMTCDNTNGTEQARLYYQTNVNNLLENNQSYLVYIEYKEAIGDGHLVANIDVYGKPQTLTRIDCYYSDFNFGSKAHRQIITTVGEDAQTDCCLNICNTVQPGEEVSVTFRVSILKDTSIWYDNFVYEPYRQGKDRPNEDYPIPINVVTGDITITSQKGIDSSNLVYHLENNYLTKWDYIENGIIHKYTNKIDSYNGEEITTEYYSTTGGLDSGATIYYRKTEPELIEIEQSGSLEVYGNNTLITNNINTEMTLTCTPDSQIEIKGKLSATAFNDKNFIGTFNLKTLTFETENTFDFKEKEFEYYKQVNNEPFKIGTFITTEVEDSDTNELVKVTAVDYGLKFATPYETSLDYESSTITMQNVFDEILTNVGVELATDSQPLVNGDFIVDSNQFVNSEVYGDVVSAIAGINGMFAIITHDDKLKLLTKNNIEYSEMSEVETEIEMTSTEVYSRIRRLTLYQDIEIQDSLMFKLSTVYPVMAEKIIVDGIVYKTPLFYYPRIELEFLNTNSETFLGKYVVMGGLDLEESQYQLGKFKIDLESNKLTRPNGTYIYPSNEIETQQVHIDFTECNYIGYRTTLLLYEPIDEENYQLYVDKYFDGDESIADNRYYPKQEITIKIYNEKNELISKPEIIEDYIELDDKRDTRPITIVQLGMSQVQGVEVQARWEEGIQQYGEHYLIINDNPFAYTMEKRRELASNMLEQVKGLGYSSFESQFAFKPYLQLGDAVKFRNKAGELVDSIVLKIDTDYDNITLSAPSIADATVDYIVNDVEQTARRAEIIANQATSDITLISKQVTNIGNTVESNYQQMTENFNNYYTIDQTNEMIINAQSGLTNSFSESGGNNIFRNTGLWFEETKDEKLYIYPNNELYPSSETYSGAVAMYEYWTGYAKRTSEDKATNNNAILIQNGSFIQEQEVPNGNYTISFYYEKLKLFATTSVIINDVEYPLESMETKLFYTGEKDTTNDEYIVQPLVVNSRRIKIEFKSNVDDGLKVYDLMCNKGSARLVYSQNENETTTDTVNISKGITITSTNMETVFKANADGIRILTIAGNVVAYFTDKGLSTKELIVENEAQIVKTLWQEVDDQTWITRI